MLSRREFLFGVAGAASAPGLFRDAWPTGPALDPFPGTDLVEGFLRRERERATPVAPTGLRRGDYLHLIDGITRFFTAHQDARGAIIDPYELKEKQYSTPAFALAAAAVCTSRPDQQLLAAARRAMGAACADLAAGKAADGHADFYTVLLLHADRLLSRLTPPDLVSPWRADLRAVAPERIYRFQPTAEKLQNWNLVAAAGERLRVADGYGRSGDWIEASLARQVEHFTASGMYRDPNDPMAYDHFARLWALDLVEEGYDGAQAERLGTLVERGAWMSLFMQSPHGELPCGGRSAHHQWNEAEQAVTFEARARRFAARGDRVAAGAFKRAARLSLQSMTRWVRPTGELWIVKNRLDPRVRHGFESYSFHSQYNLLAAGMLALAWLRADEGIPERACPADSGGYAFALQPAFHKVFLAAGGYFVEIDTGADPHYNPTGILRVHHRGVLPETLSDGTTPACEYTVPARPSRALAVGPEWRGPDGQWHGLADHAAADLEETAVRVVRADANGVEVELTYTGRLKGGATAVRETIAATALGVDVRHAVEGDVSGVRQTVPVLVDDGRTASRIEVNGGTAVVERDGRRLLVRAAAGAITRAGLREPCRNGFVDALIVEGRDRTARCVLQARA
jgi:hypothetical protein